MFDFFSPRIFFPVSALSFLLAGILGAALFPQFTVPFAVVLLHFLGIALFLSGTFSAGRLGKILGNGWLVLSVLSILVLYFSYLNFPGYAGISLLTPVLLYYIRRYQRSFPYPLMLTGVGLSIVYLFSNGIPLLDPGLRDAGFPVLWFVSLLFFFLGFGLRLQNAGIREILCLSLFGSVLLGLGGYRGPVLILCISAIACLYHRKLVDFKRIVAFFILLFLFVAVMGWFVAKPNLGPAQLFFFRSAYTNWIEGSILLNSPPYGFKEGAMWLETNPRFAIGAAFAGKHRSITGGFFGSLWFDSGFIGFSMGSILAGAVMQNIYARRGAVPAAYWLAAAYLAISVETGVDFVHIAVFLVSLFFVASRKHDTRL